MKSLQETSTMTVAVRLVLLPTLVALTTMKRSTLRPKGYLEVTDCCHSTVCLQSEEILKAAANADSAKRDTIGQGQAIQRQPLSGVLRKILSRKDAVALRYARASVPIISC